MKGLEHIYQTRCFSKALEITGNMQYCVKITGGGGGGALVRISGL